MGLTHVGSILSAGRNDLYGLIDLQVVQTEVGNFLITGAQATGALQTYRFYSDQMGNRRSSVAFSEVTGSATLNAFEVLQFDEDYYILTAGRYEDRAGLVHLRANGLFGSATAVTGTADNYAQFEVLESLQFGENRYVYASSLGSSSFETYRVEADLSFTHWRSWEDDADLALGDIAQFTTFSAGHKAFVIAASAFDAGVSVFQAGAAGNLRHRDTVTPQDGSGFDLIQDVKVVSVADQRFLVLAAAGTDSLTVFKVNNHGKLTEVFHAMDQRDTRFEDARVLETFSVGKRGFILAAGSDDGVTLFEVLPDGHLALHLVLEDQFDTTLDNISDISVSELGRDIVVLVASETEHGVTQFQLETDTLGALIEGGRGRQTLAGTSKDDVIYGWGQGDALFGGAGDDILNGGRGRDELTGGSGADLFVFAPDGRQDVITDFELGQDRIDLSAFDLINHVQDLDIRPQPFGAVIFANEEAIRVYSADGQKLMVEDFTLNDFVFL